MVLWSSWASSLANNRGGVADYLRTKLAESTITQLVQAIEFYKTQNGSYPDSLNTLKESLPENSMEFVHDPSDVQIGGEGREFHYELVDANHYYLLGVGADGQPYTNDDILPKIEIGPGGKIGLLIKPVK